MKLEVGKRYVMLNGSVTGPLLLNDNALYGYFDRESKYSWTSSGQYATDRRNDPCDIVSEYIEPASEPLRWVENCKPDKPGIWAWKYADWNGITNISGIIAHADLVHAASSGVEWCYLGPIPEILPPKKKVVQRLWIRRNFGHDYYDYLWVTEPTEPGGYIRTDETREVEC